MNFTPSTSFGDAFPNASFDGQYQDFPWIPITKTVPTPPPATTSNPQFLMLLGAGT